MRPSDMVSGGWIPVFRSLHACPSLLPSLGSMGGGGGVLEPSRVFATPGTAMLFSPLTQWLVFTLQVSARMSPPPGAPPGLP